MEHISVCSSKGYISSGTDLSAEEPGGVTNLSGADMPGPSEYLRTRQKDGKPLGADVLFAETWRWLKERACDKFINPRLVEAYAQAFARYIQCEEAISAYGLLGRNLPPVGPLPAPSCR